MPGSPSYMAPGSPFTDGHFGPRPIEDPQRVERDTCDSPERQQVRQMSGHGRPPVRPAVPGISRLPSASLAVRQPSVTWRTHPLPACCYLVTAVGRPSSLVGRALNPANHPAASGSSTRGRAVSRLQRDLDHLPLAEATCRDLHLTAGYQRPLARLEPVADLRGVRHRLHSIVEHPVC